MTGDLIKASEVQERLGLSRKAVVKMMREVDAIPAGRCGGKPEFVTTVKSVELLLIGRAARKMAGTIPMNPLSGAAVKLALEAYLANKEQIRVLAERKEEEAAKEGGRG